MPKIQLVTDIFLYISPSCYLHVFLNKITVEKENKVGNQGSGWFS